MLKNYIKIAWKVLQRRKFFTFISLFGISFTLMILMVVTSIIDNVAGSVTPEKKMDRMLFVASMFQQFKDGGMMIGPTSYTFMHKFVKPLQAPEKVSIYTIFYVANSYVGNKKLVLDRKFTDSEFWEVMDFEFVEGRGFSKIDVENANRVVVINEETRDQYFGKEGVIGKEMEIDNTNFKVIGVVKNVPPTRIQTYADVWSPISTSREMTLDNNMQGSFMATLLAKSSSDFPKIQEEFASQLKKWQNPDPANINYLKSYAEPIPETFARLTLGNAENNNIALLYTGVIVLIVLFMLLPAINLININISRIMERTSEIGVRKAFGASRGTLVGQFIIENIFLTLIGGLFGFVLSAFVLMMINQSQVIPYTNFSINLNIFLYGLLFALIFGLISGVYPAFKMSRLQAVEALKGGKL